MHKDLERIIVDERSIHDFITKTADRINSDYLGSELVLVPVLTGAMFFAVDLARRLTVPLQIECVKASSYRSGTVSGELVLELDVKSDIAGKHVLLAEDIIDTGKTLFHMKKMFLERGAASVKVCALLDKPSRRTANIALDYEGVEIPDEFVVGYGLDYNGEYRNLPYVGALKKEIYE